MPVTEIPLKFVKVFLVENSKGEVVLIDSGVPGSWGRIEEVMKRKNYVDRLRAVVFTHSHGDHIGGAPELKVDVPLLIHKEGMEFLRTGRWRKPVIHSKFYSLGFALISYFMKGKGEVKGRVEELKEDYLTDGVKVIYTPGHTSDSVILYVEEESSVIVGDTLQGTSSGLKLPVIYEDREALIKSVEKIMSLEPRFVYVSHGLSGPPRWPTLKASH